MKIYRDLSLWLENKKPHGPTSIGFVPTMGALHDGHLSLIRQSKKENLNTVVSIFVNPTQFNSEEDLRNYPQTLDADILKLSTAGVDALLLPSNKDMYPMDYAFSVDESVISKQLCGKYRPGHFKGVLTVVMKLLNLTGADRAYFGEKDYQQFLLIQQMVQAFFMPVEIIPCPTLRDREGLALSSRNQRLQPEELKVAQSVNKILRDKNLSTQECLASLQNLGLKIDYLEDHWNRRFVAASIGPVRIIDNVPL